jgi:hypothetical protein
MAKDTYYFQHDYEPTSDPKIQALLNSFGGLGYGLWWRIIEMLHSEELHKLQHKKFIYLAIAGQMSTSVEQVEQFINFCINDVELFETDGAFFWSDRVNRNIEKRTDISTKRSFAGKESARQRNISSTSVQQVLTDVQQNPTKERKGNKRKGKEIESTIPSFFDFYEYAKTLDGFHEQLEKPIKRKYDSWVANDWKDGKDNKITNWKSKLINTMPYIVTANPPTRSTFKYPFPR